eukprot:693505-Prorocentrum_minimum.AAC.1
MIGAQVRELARVRTSCMKAVAAAGVWHPPGAAMAVVSFSWHRLCLLNPDLPRAIRKATAATMAARLARLTAQQVSDWSIVRICLRFLRLIGPS